MRTLLLTTALCLVATMAGVVRPGSPQAAVPQLINYQGKLTNASGQPITSAVTLKFRIYDTPTGGTLLWGPESQPVTPDANGVYNVILGQGTPPVPFPANLFAATPRYIGVEVNSEGEMTPRQQITAVAYSLRVATVDGATGGTISGDVSIQSDLSVSGKATIGPNGNSGGFAFVAGASNNVTNIGATVGGGQSNNASRDFATIDGGIGNNASGENSTVGGGRFNTAAGSNSTVPGGASNRADGDYSFAAGRRARAFHTGTFVWADSNDFQFASEGPNQFSARTTGGARFVTATDGAGNPTAGVFLFGGANSWSSISDRNAKTNF